MALDLKTRLRVYLASAPQTERSIGVLEISHPAMSKTWFLWREPYAGQVTTETGDVVDVLCTNIQPRLAGSEGSLDQRFDVLIDTVDIEDTFRAEMDSVPLGDPRRVLMVYREYLSDDLTEPQARVPLQVENCSYQVGAATLTAVSPRLNATSTGIFYAPRDIPMLRGFART